MKRLRENDIVTLGLPREIRAYTQNAVDCVVLAISGRTASLEALEKSAWIRVPDEVDPVYMTFTQLGALVSLRGRLLATGAVGELRFVVSDDAQVRPDSPTRATVALPVRVSRMGSGEAFEATTVDISTNGLRIECALEARSGELLECSLTLPNREREVHVVGEVVQAVAGAFALTFTKATTSLDTRLALFELVTAQCRSEWRRKAKNVAGGSANEL